MSTGYGNELDDNDLEELREFIRNYYRDAVAEIQPRAQVQGNVNSDTRNHARGLNDLHEFLRTTSPFEPEVQPSLQVPQHANYMGTVADIQPPAQDQGNVISEIWNRARDLNDSRHFFRTISSNPEPEVQPSTQAPGNAISVTDCSISAWGCVAQIQSPAQNQGNVNSGIGNHARGLNDLRQFFRTISTNPEPEVQHSTQAPGNSISITERSVSAWGTMAQIQSPAQNQGNVNSGIGNHARGLNDLRQFFRTISSNPEPEMQHSTQAPGNSISVTERSVSAWGTMAQIQSPAQNQGIANSGIGNHARGLNDLRQFFRTISSNPEPEMQHSTQAPGNSISVTERSVSAWGTMAQIQSPAQNQGNVNSGIGNHARGLNDLRQFFRTISSNPEPEVQHSTQAPGNSISVTERSVSAWGTMAQIQSPAQNQGNANSGIGNHARGLNDLRQFFRTISSNPEPEVQHSTQAPGNSISVTERSVSAWGTMAQIQSPAQNQGNANSGIGNHARGLNDLRQLFRTISSNPEPEEQPSTQAPGAAISGNDRNASLWGSVAEIQSSAQVQGNSNSEIGYHARGLNELRQFFRTISSNPEPEVQPSTQAPGYAISAPDRSASARSFDPVIQRPTQGQRDLNSGLDRSSEDIREYFRTYSPYSFDSEAQSSQIPQYLFRVPGPSTPVRSYDPVGQRSTPDQGSFSSAEDGEETLEELRDYFRAYRPDFDLDLLTTPLPETPRSESGDSDPPRYFPVSPPSTSTGSSAASLDDSALTNLFANLAVVAQQTANVMDTEYRLQIPPHILGNLLGEDNVNPVPESAWIEATAGSQCPIIAWDMPTSPSTPTTYPTYPTYPTHPTQPTCPTQRPQRSVPTIAALLIIILLILSRHRYPYNLMDFPY